MKTVVFSSTPESVKLAKVFGYEEWLIGRDRRRKTSSEGHPNGCR
jgi:hypothetical protein